MKPVVLFVDLLEDFFAAPPLALRRGSISASVNELAALARRRGWPVVWVRQEFEADLADAFLSMRDRGTRITIKGTAGSGLISELVREPGDIEIVKKRYSAFFGTGLEALLDAIGCSHAIVGGVNTHACVRTTAIDAYQRDYRVVLAVDTIASYDERYHEESLRYLQQAIGEAMTNEELRDVARA